MAQFAPRTTLHRFPSYNPLSSLGKLVLIHHQVSGFKIFFSWTKRDCRFYYYNLAPVHGMYYLPFCYATKALEHQVNRCKRYIKNVSEVSTVNLKFGI